MTSIDPSGVMILKSNCILGESSDVWHYLFGDHIETKCINNQEYNVVALSARTVEFI